MSLEVGNMASGIGSLPLKMEPGKPGPSNEREKTRTGCDTVAGHVQPITPQQAPRRHWGTMRDAALAE